MWSGFPCGTPPWGEPGTSLARPARRRFVFYGLSYITENPRNTVLHVLPGSKIQFYNSTGVRGFKHISAQNELKPKIYTVLLTGGLLE